MTSGECFENKWLYMKFKCVGKYLSAERLLTCEWTRKYLNTAHVILLWNNSIFLPRCWRKMKIYETDVPMMFSLSAHDLFCSVLFFLRYIVFSGSMHFWNWYNFVLNISCTLTIFTVKQRFQIITYFLQIHLHPLQIPVIILQFY